MRCPFTFIAAEFVPICADLLSYPVSRAVTASSAVPGAFTSIIIKNYAGTCGYQLPDWVTKVMDERHVNTRQYHLAKILSNYQDTENQPYIHLLDGGISDNLGIRVISLLCPIALPLSFQPQPYTFSLELSYLTPETSPFIQYPAPSIENPASIIPHPEIHRIPLPAIPHQIVPPQKHFI